ncbi:MerR family transcriptional regulator [Cryptosporangium aurantiacum]|uniref:MerR family regulatory protein n=1 Tax=Cryptosporangium aurantiacum TaxID=134849 RepID=A0A1M7RMB5_9ACTN|nr:MerR family transcriptional regulator [Cryptosporangium aurantiacum]SHN47467.1 MerR family regulatory protein [Cryptosporangium aurantiacum]
MTTSGSSARAYLSIGEVLSQLRPEFPDTTISKLRFLESEGLVEPERTPAGYRKYSPEDVARLRYVLAAQRDQYLPLRVIREHLQAIDRGAPGADGDRPDQRALVANDALPAAGDFSRPEVDVRLSRSDLLARTGITDAQLKQIENYGLVSARGAGWYDADGLAVAETVVRMAEFGLEPRHLRGYKTAADREVGLFEQVVAPVARQRGPEAKARAEEIVRELAALSLRLHTALVQARLRGSLGG